MIDTVHKYQNRNNPQPVCDHAGCDGAGDYRAPKSPDRLNDYYWFCLDHVRQYNKNWSYNAGKTAQEIEQQIRSDTIGNRPTWSRQNGTPHLDDPLDISGAGGFGMFGDGVGDDTPHSPPMPDDVAHAYAVLGVGADCADDDLKSTYKKLAKQHHPDLNTGDKTAENKFKAVTTAYKTICDFRGI